MAKKKKPVTRELVKHKPVKKRPKSLGPEERLRQFSRSNPLYNTARCYVEEEHRYMTLKEATERLLRLQREGKFSYTH